MPSAKRKVEFDVVNEQAILGSMLLDAPVRKRLVRRLSPDTFLAPQHRALAAALKTCENNALEPTPEALAANGDPASWGGSDYVAMLKTSAAPRANLLRHIQALEWDSLRAGVLQGAFSTLTEALCDPRATIEATQAAARSVLGALESAGGRRYMRDKNALARAWKAELAVRRAAGNFVGTGFDSIDQNLLEGFAAGNITVLAGLPGMGKSTFIANVIVRLADREVPTLLGAWEMGSTSTLDIMTSAIAQVDLAKVLRPTDWQLTDEEAAELHRAADWVTENIRFMDNAFFAPLDGKRPSNARNLEKLEGYIAESGCQVFVADLWERMLSWTDPSDVAAALYRMQAIAEEYGVHMVLLQQLRLKDLEKRADKRPTREAVKGTAAYVEAADLLLGVHREHPFKPGRPDDTMEVICLKQRKGRCPWAVGIEYRPEQCALEGHGEVIEYDPGFASGEGELPSDGDEAPVFKKPTRRRRRD